MAKKTWTVNLDGFEHKIELDHGTISGKRVITLNGAIIEESKKLMDYGTDHILKIGEHVLGVHIRPGGFSFKYDLSVDGVSVETGETTTIIDGTPTKLYTGETATLMQKTKLFKQLNSAAGWFFWIAGMTLINSIVYLLNVDYYFVIGLGITQIIDGIFYFASTELAPEMGPLVIFFGLAINLVILGVFVLFGVMGRKAKRWAFIAGLVIYGLDAFILIYFQDILGFLFHGLALFGFVQGLRAIKKLDEIDIQQSPSTPDYKAY